MFNLIIIVLQLTDGSRSMSYTAFARRMVIMWLTRVLEYATAALALGLVVRVEERPLGLLEAPNHSQQLVEGLVHVHTQLGAALDVGDL